MKNKPVLDIGDFAVGTIEPDTTMYLIVGRDGIKLGVVDAVKLVCLGPQKPLWLDRSLLLKPHSLQQERYDKTIAAVTRANLARNLGENLT